MLKKPSLPFLGFLQATGLIVYVGFISWFLTLLGNRVGNNQGNNFYVPIIFLLIFIISAVISALLFLGRAGYLFWEKHYKESFTLLGWTIGWVVLYFTVLVTVIVCASK
jgi:hypothetical protein